MKFDTIEHSRSPSPTFLIRKLLHWICRYMMYLCQAHTVDVDRVQKIMNLKSGMGEVEMFNSKKNDTIEHKLSDGLTDGRTGSFRFYL